MKRRLLALLLSAAMAVTMVAPVMAEEVVVNEDGTVENPEAVEVDENKLVFWSLFSGGDGGFMDQIISEYNATGPAKEVQSIMLVWADYYTKLTTAVATGNGPDVGVSHASRLGMLINDGVIEPLNPYLDELGINLSDYFAQGSIDAVTVDGDIYAIPLDTHAEILYFNKDILEEAGVELNADGVIDINTPEDFTAVCDKIKAVMGEGESTIAITSKDDDPFRVWWATYIQMGGTPLMNEDQTDAGLDKEIAKAAAEFTKSLYDNGYALTGIEDHQKFFQAGTAGLLIGGTWAMGALEQTEGLNFGAMAWPQMFGTGTFADQHTFVLPVNPDRTEEETLAAVQFMFSAPTEGGVIWANSGQVPAATAVVESEEYLALPYRSGTVSVLETAAYPVNCPTHLAMEADIKNALNEYWADTIDSETVADYIEEAVLNNLP